jgi:hypothetical protein
VRATAGRRIRSVVEFMVLMEQLRRHQRTHSYARARHHNARQTDGSAICCSSRQIWRCVMACRRHRCRANGARRGGMPLPMASITSWLVRAPIPLGHQWIWTYAKLGSRSTEPLGVIDLITQLYQVSFLVSSCYVRSEAADQKLECFVFVQFIFRVNPGRVP